MQQLDVGKNGGGWTGRKTSLSVGSLNLEKGCELPHAQ